MSDNLTYKTSLREQRIRLLKLQADIKELELQQLQKKIIPIVEPVTEIALLKKELAEQKKCTSIAIQEVIKLEKENKHFIRIREIFLGE